MSRSPSTHTGLPQVLANAARLRMEQFGRVFAGRRIRFVRIDEMIGMSCDWAPRLAGRFDTIVAMPRSGLIVGSLLADALRLPLTTPDLLAEGRLLMGSQALGTPDQRILLVDDSISSGRQMRQAVADLREREPHADVTTAVLLPHQRSVDLVDEYYRVIRHPRLFEWDLVHTKKFKSVAFDMDGVLCEDVPESCEADEERYVEWISGCRPFLLPRYEIDYIVTNRLERYRPQTEAWLARHGVRYRHLVMWDLPGKDQRHGRFAANKIRQVLAIRPKLFIESSFWQARKIWASTGVPTLCTDNMALLG